MQTVVRYTVVNQDGRPVIRAVSVRRPIENRPVHGAQPAPEAQGLIATGQRDRSFVRRLRQLRLRESH